MRLDYSLMPRGQLSKHTKTFIDPEEKSYDSSKLADSKRRVAALCPDGRIRAGKCSIGTRFAKRNHSGGKNKGDERLVELIPAIIFFKGSVHGVIYEYHIAPNETVVFFEPHASHAHLFKSSSDN